MFLFVISVLWVWFLVFGWFGVLFINIKIKFINGFPGPALPHATFQVRILFFSDKLLHIIKDLKCQQIPEQHQNPIVSEGSSSESEGNQDLIFNSVIIVGKQAVKK